MNPINSRKYCQAIVQKRAKSFYVALKFLPKEKRQALYALYAFARLADDIVDGSVLHMDLSLLRKNLDHLYDKPVVTDSTDYMASLSHSIQRFSLPRKPFDDLLEGMEMDEGEIHFKSWEETKDYCYKAASTVGLLCVEVFEYDDPNARIYANELGIAMQLTNILRDLKEDFDRGRQYLPEDDFEAFGLSYKELVGQGKQEETEKFIRFQADRAEVHYERAAKLFPMVKKNARHCPKALSYLYQEILKEIKKEPLKALHQKISLSKKTKVKVVLKAMFGR